MFKHLGEAPDSTGNVRRSQRRRSRRRALGNRLRRSLAAEPLEGRLLLASDVFVSSDDVPGTYLRTQVGTEVTYSPVADTAQIGDFMIRGDLSQGRNVIVNTVNGGGGLQGNLILTGANLTVATDADSILDLRADNDLIFQGSQVAATSSLMRVILNSDRDATGAGRVEIDSGSTINSGGADITIGGGLDPASLPAVGTTLEPTGVSVFGTIMAGTGNVSVRGQGLNLDGPVGNADGILVEGTIDTTTGNVSLIGSGGSTTGSGNDGIVLDFGVIGSNSGDVSIMGVGGGTGSASNGVMLVDSGLISVTDGTIDLSGTGAASGSGAGVALTTDGDVIESLGSASITIRGAGSGGTAGLQFLGEIGGVTAAGDITLVSDRVDLLGPFAFIEGSGDLVIRPMDPSASIGIGGGAGTLDLSDAELALLSDGFSSITIGDLSAGSGTVAVDSAVVRDPITIVGGSISVDNGISGSGGITLTARDDNSLGQDIAINSGVINDALGDVTINAADDLLVAAGTTVRSTKPLGKVSVNIDQAAGEVIGSRLFLNGTLASSQNTITAIDPSSPHQILIGSGPSALGVEMSGADSGTISLDAEKIDYVGIRDIQVPIAPSDAVITTVASDELVSVSESGDLIAIVVDMGQSITVQEPATSLTLNTGGGTDVVNVASLSVNFSDALFVQDGDSSVNDTVHVDGKITTTVGGLEIDALHINVNADLDVGDALVLGNPINSGLITVATGNVLAVAIQQFQDAVLVSSDATFATTSGPILFFAEIDGANALTIDAASTVDFRGIVGGGQQLASLSVKSANDQIVIGGNVTTTGQQVFDAPVRVTGSPALSLTSKDGPITFSSSIDDATPDSTELNLSTTGIVGLAGDLGMAGRLRSLSVSSAGPFATPNNLSVLNDLSLKVIDTTGTADELVIRGSVQSSSGNVIFSGGDLVEVQSGASVLALQGNVVIDADPAVADPDPGVGGAVVVSGSLASSTGAFLSGGLDADQFSVSTQSGTALTITGNDPLTSPGDALSLDAAGASVAIDAGSGDLSIGGSPPISTSGIEDVVVSNVGTLTINGSDAADDVVIASDPNVGGGELLTVNGSTPIAFNSISQIIYGGGAGDDRLTFDATDGLSATPITFHGQGQDGSLGGDRLTILGTFTTQTFNYDAAGPEGNRGSIRLDGSVMTYTGLEPIDAGNSDDTILNLSTGQPNKAILQGGAAADTIELVDDGSSFEDTVIPNPSNSLTINLGDQGDGLKLSTLNAGFSASVIIRGGNGMDDVAVSGLTLDATPGRALDVEAVEKLEVVDSTFSNNTSDLGAGLRVVGGTTQISNSTFRNNTAGGDVAPGGGAIFTDSDTTIANNTVIDGNLATGPQGSGGGILVGPSGRLTLSDSTISNNEATNDGGGIAISAAGSSVTLLRATVTQNTAGDSGGGLMAEGATVTVTDSTFTSNEAKGLSTLDGLGGGLLVVAQQGSGAFTLTNTNFDLNTALGGGGAAEFVDVDGSISGGLFTSNTVNGNGITYDTGGGALAIVGRNRTTSVSITGATFDGNAAPAAGGIGSIDSTVVINNSIIRNNRATDSVAGAGGIGVLASSPIGGNLLEISDSTVSGNTADGEAGGIGVIDGTAVVVNSTIDANSAVGGRGGGIGVMNVNAPANLVVSASTISSNTASVSGGGIGVLNSGLDLENVTLVLNDALSSSGGGIAYQNDDDALTPSIRYSTIASNNSLAGGSNIGVAGFGIDVSGTIFSDGDCLVSVGGLNSLGGNLDSGESCGFNQPTDLINTDPQLGSLQDNGGDVFTIALQPSSPAIDAGPLTGPDTDARGVVRPIDGDGDGSFLFDIGAFEAQAVPKLIVSDVTVDENAAIATVTVTLLLSGFIDTGLSVDYATSAIAPASSPNDYSDTSGTLMFSGSSGETQSFSIALVDDDIIEPTEAILVTLSNPSDGSVDASDTGLVTVVDDDFGTLSVDDVTVGEGGGSATVTVTVDRAVQGGFAVDIATTDGTATHPQDYVAASGTLDFLGNAGESRTFSVSINDDDDVEGNEFLNVTLSNPSISQLDATDSAAINITDNDDLGQSIVGHVFCDANNNRIEESGEEAPDMQVFLDSNANGELDSGERATRTDSGGDYRFDNVLTTDANVTVQVIPDCNTVTEDPLITRMMVDVGDLASSIVSADVDGDSDRDLLVTGDLSGTLTVLENNGGVFTQRNVLSIPDRPQSVFAYEPTVGEALFAVAAIGAGGDPGQVFLLDRQSLLSGNTQSGLPAGNGPIDVLIDDFDGDGLPDLVAGSFRSSDVTMHLSQTGEVTTLPSDAGQVFSIASGNLNEAGTAPELVVAGVGYEGGGDARIEVFSTSSAGVMVKTVSVSSAATISVIAEDLNGDGLDEILALSHAGTLTVYRFSGDAILETIATNIASGATSFAVGDFNDDGKKDVAVANQAGQFIEILVGGGDGRFAHVTTIEDIATPTDLIVDDFNGDGFGDIAVTNLLTDANLSVPGAPQLTLPSSVTILLMDIATRNVVVTANTVANFDLPTADPSILLDVNADNQISALDALLVINTLSRLPSAEAELPVSSGRASTDVNGDGRTSAIDALMIINRLSMTDRGEPIAQQFVETLADDDDHDQLTAATDWVHRAQLI